MNKPDENHQWELPQLNHEVVFPADMRDQTAGVLVQEKESHDEFKPSGKAQQRIVEIGTRPLPAEMPYTKKDVTTISEGEITLNFQDTDIREFIKLVIGDILGLNYVIDQEVAGKINLQTARPLHKEELLPLLEKVLSMSGAALIHSQGLYQILPRTRAAQASLSPGIGPVGDGYSIRIVPLDYIAAREMQKILDPFLGEGSELRADSNRNLLILGGAAHELDVLQNTIDLFDVDWLRGMSVGIYPLEYVSPRHMESELNAVLNAVHGDKTGTPMQGMIRMVPLERLSSILLIGATPSALREVELWLYRLDKPGESVDRRLYVYRLKNAKASELADILSTIFDRGPRSKHATKPSLAPGLHPVELTTLPVAGMPETRDYESHSTNVMGEQDIAATSGNPVQVIADDTRNSLLIMSTPHDYRMIKAAIEELDTMPLQVLIEASILEVTLADDLFYGVEWFLKNSVGDKSGRGVLDLGIPGIGPLAPAFSYTIMDSVGDVRFVLNALAERTNLNILSAPTLMVLDNQTAHINVGDEIPVPSRQSISTIDPGAPLVSEIQFRRTGVSLHVTPQVNESGLVSMEIKQEVSNAVTTTSSNIDAPTIQQRIIESTVAVQHGDTILLGGLIRDSRFQDNRGIPLLHHIPIIGKLFGSSGHEYARTELLVLLTPHVVRNRHESNSITDELIRRMRTIQPIYFAPAEGGS